MRKQVSFPRVMKCTALVTLTVTAVLALINHFFPREWLAAIAISTGTTFYHFAMRLTVGTIVPKLLPSPRHHKWFLQQSFEPKLYKLLRVKQWKDHMPTYDPASFSLEENTRSRSWTTAAYPKRYMRLSFSSALSPLSLRFGGVFSRCF